MFILNFVIFYFNANISMSQAVVPSSVEVGKDMDVSPATPSIYASTVHHGGPKEEYVGGEQVNGKFCNFLFQL